MEMLACLETRRSVRRFKDEAVSEETVKELVRRASYAPSWKNTQTVRWIAVTDKALLHKLAQSAAQAFAGNAAIFENAPLVMVETCISGRAGFERDGSYSTSKGDRWEMFDAGVAAQTMCLGAWELGLGSVIMGALDMEDIADIVGLAPGRTVSCLIALGVPEQEPPMPKRKTVDDLLS